MIGQGKALRSEGRMGVEDLWARHKQVLAAVEGGLPISEVARMSGLPAATVARLGGGRYIEERKNHPSAVVAAAG